MVRCGKINCVNSDAESCTGIGVVAGFAGAVGMMESSHMKMAELISSIVYLHTLQYIRAIGKTRNHLSTFVIYAIVYMMLLQS